MHTLSSPLENIKQGGKSVYKLNARTDNTFYISETNKQNKTMENYYRTIQEQFRSESEKAKNITATTLADAEEKRKRERERKKKTCNM